MSKVEKVRLPYYYQGKEEGTSSSMQEPTPEC